MTYLLANLLRALAGLLVTWWLGASDTAGRDHGRLRLPLGGAQLPGLAWPSPGPVGWLLTVPLGRGTQGSGLTRLGQRPQGDAGL